MATPNEPARDDEGYALWKRLLDRDPVASSDFSTIYFLRICAWLEERYPRASEEDRLTAAGEAIFNLIIHPAIYNPERQTIEIFLRMSAAADLKNLLRAESRHARRRADWEVVELSTDAGKYLADETADPARLVDDAASDLDPGLAAVLEGLPAEEKQALRLIAAGERSTRVFATALGIGHLPPPEQAREVKRVKDRLKKRLERWRDNHG